MKFYENFYSVCSALQCNTLDIIATKWVTEWLSKYVTDEWMEEPNSNDATDYSLHSHMYVHNANANANDVCVEYKKEKQNKVAQMHLCA